MNPKTPKVRVRGELIHTHTHAEPYHPKPPNDTLLFLLSMVSLPQSPPLCLPSLLIVSGCASVALSLCSLSLSLSTPLFLCCSTSSFSTYKYSHLFQMPSFACFLSVHFLPSPPSLPPFPSLTLIQCTQPAESEGRSRNRNEGIHDVLSLSLSHSQSLQSLSLSFILSLSLSAFRTENLSYIINGDKCTSVHEFNRDFSSIKGSSTLKNTDLRILCDVIDHPCNL